MQLTFMLKIDSVFLSISEAGGTMIFTVLESQLLDTKERVQLAINRKASGSGDMKCHTYILADPYIDVINRQLEGVHCY